MATSVRGEPETGSLRDDLASLKIERSGKATYRPVQGTRARAASASSS